MVSIMFQAFLLPPLFQFCSISPVTLVFYLVEWIFDDQMFDDQNDSKATHQIQIFTSLTKEKTLHSILQFFRLNIMKRSITTPIGNKSAEKL